MGKMKGIIRSIKGTARNKAVVAAGAATAVMSVANSAFASTPPTINVEYGELFSGVMTEAVKGVTEVLPIAVPVLGVIAAVTLGTKIFKKFTGH